MLARVPRWYRNGLVVWLCTGLPLLLVGLLLGDGGWRWSPPAGGEGSGWMLAMAAMFHPLLTLPVALWQGILGTNDAGKSTLGAWEGRR